MLLATVGEKEKWQCRTDRMDSAHHGIGKVGEMAECAHLLCCG